jgi:hypothetical protein
MSDPRWFQLTFAAGAFFGLGLNRLIVWLDSIWGARKARR